MEYKGYEIIPAAAGWVGTGTCQSMFSIYKQEGERYINVHRARPEGSYSHEVLAFNAAITAARALIDAGGPFTPDR